ncbi:hypothetical protein NQ314_008363 [Rhamnusium bicolor]|uniref:Acyltransferase 3 domain-containing protein n=1 Tax=Rhamnusium bicolor TaxID=1586634 RepID=A0AAV8YE14_9CUCU|nr:hypothetical protein NQ314_008363 [Rhamnusium bicolor]
MTTSTIYDIYLHKTQSKSRHPLLLAFSVFSNGRKLLHVSKNSREQIQTFHGLRVLSMMWIIAGHGFVMLQTSNVTNVDDRDNWTNHMKAVYITAGPLAVDTFFFISGFLLAFHYFKQKTRTLKAQVLSIPHMFLHRYLRLTPAVLMIYLVTISIFKHLGSGPVWNTGEEYFAEPCRKYWWSFFLYIQNYYNYDDLFVSQSLIFYLNTYYDTHSRFINYYIGVALAIFMREKKDKPFLYMVKNQHLSIANLIIWIVMLLGMLTIVLCYQEVQMNHGYESQSVFYSLMRPAWCIGLSWIVYSCYHGYGGVVNWILTGPTMQVMGRLTYCMYLTHVSVMAYIVFTPRDRIYFSDYNEFYFWCGHFIVSAIVSIFWTLAFESPLLIIEKFLLGSGNKTSNQSQVSEPQNGNKSTEMKKANVY